MQNYNDGKRKSFYCLAINLLSLPDIRDAPTRLKADTAPGQAVTKEQVLRTVSVFEEQAKLIGIEFKLKKNDV